MHLARSRPRIPLALALPVMALGLAAPFHMAWAQGPAPQAPPPGGPPGAAPAAPPAAPAAAQPPAPPGKPGAKPDEEVAKLVADAQKAAKANKWEDARALYERAEKLKPSYKLAVELARAETAAGKAKNAANRVATALADAPEDLPDADRKAGEAVLAAAKAKIGELHFNVRPNGAEVFVDGKPIGKAPLEGPLFVDPGAVEVSAKLEGYSGVRTQRVIAAGGVETFELSLLRSGPVDVPAGGTSALRPPSQLFRGVNPPILIGGVAGSFVFFFMGTSFAIVSDLKSSHSHALEQPGAPCGAVSACKTQFDALQSSKVTFAGASLWSYIASATLLAGSGAYWATMVITTPKQLKGNLEVRPGLAGASLTYRW